MAWSSRLAPLLATALTVVGAAAARAAEGSAPVGSIAFHADPGGSDDLRFSSYRNRDPLLRGIGNAEIVVVSLARASPRNITRSSYWKGDLEWSPDGRFIAFAQRRDFGPNGHFRLGVVPSSSGPATFLPPVSAAPSDPANNCCPAWTS